MSHDAMRDPALAVLLLGNYRPTISLVRELKALGYRTIVGRGGGEGGAEYSRFTDEVWDHPQLEGDPERFLLALTSFLAGRADIGIVFPVAESFVKVVSAARDRLPADRVYAIPPPAVVATALDKIATWELAASVDVPVAPHGPVDSYARLRERCAEVGYPLVIRPLESTHRLAGAKALIVESPGDLTRALPSWPKGQAALLVQRYATGPRHNLYFAARAGRLVRILETLIDRTDRPDDTGLAVEGRTVTPSNDLLGFTERLVEVLDYTGVGCAQFLRDPETGAVTFLEVNPRVAGNHAIAEAAGLELGRLSILLATPGAPDLPFVRGTPGLVYAWTYGDLRGLVLGLGEGLPLRRAVGWAARLLRALLRADVHITWRWDDPLPTLALYGRKLRPRSLPSLPRLLVTRTPPSPS